MNLPVLTCFFLGRGHLFIFGPPFHWGAVHMQKSAHSTSVQMGDLHIHPVTTRLSWETMAAAIHTRLPVPEHHRGAVYALAWRLLLSSMFLRFTDTVLFHYCAVVYYINLSKCFHRFIYPFYCWWMFRLFLILSCGEYSRKCLLVHICTYFCVAYF